jgi:hypothetical protein
MLRTSSKYKANSHCLREQLKYADKKKRLAMSRLNRPEAAAIVNMCAELIFEISKNFPLDRASIFRLAYEVGLGIHATVGTFASRISDEEYRVRRMICVNQRPAHTALGIECNY